MLQKELLNADKSVRQTMKEKENLIPEKLKLKEQISFKLTKVDKSTDLLESANSDLEEKRKVLAAIENELDSVSKELKAFEGNFLL